MPKSTDFAALPTTLYLEGLDNYARRWLKANARYQTQSMLLDQPGGETEIKDAMLSVAEALLISDGVALKVTGENVTLPILARAFGASQTVELIRRGHVQFIGQGNDPGALVDPSAIRQGDGSAVPPGNPMVATIDYSGFEPQVFRAGRLDAEASNVLALRRFGNQVGLNHEQCRILAKGARKKTLVVGPERLAEATKRVGDAYASEALAPLGLSPKIARDRNEYQDKEYVHLIAQVAQTETLLELNLDPYQMPDYWAAIRSFTTEFTSAGQVMRSVDAIMELRGFPDLRTLFSDRVLKLEDILSLTAHPATSAFRRWLWSKPDPRDAIAVLTDFIGELSGKETNALKVYLVRAAKIIGITLMQDRSFDALGVPNDVRPFVDAGVALLTDQAFERFKSRPPSAFFDEILQPNIHRGASS